MQFLYFLPRDTQTECRNLQELVNAGATHIDVTRPFTGNFTLACPGDQPGSIVTLADPEPGSMPPVARYDPANQVWRKARGGKYWVGMEKSARPTPESLRRKKMLGGEVARLQDGNDWIVPVCVPAIFKEHMSGHNLPMRMDLDEEERITGTLVESFVPLAEACFDYFKEYAYGEADEKTTPMERMNRRIDLAVQLLALNYHVGKLEVIGMLGLFASNNWMNVLRAAIEADAIDAMLEEFSKKASASGDSATGPGTSDVAEPSGAATSS